MGRWFSSIELKIMKGCVYRVSVENLHLLVSIFFFLRAHTKRLVFGKHPYFLVHELDTATTRASDPKNSISILRCLIDVFYLLTEFFVAPPVHINQFFTFKNHTTDRSTLILSQTQNKGSSEWSGSSSDFVVLYRTIRQSREWWWCSKDEGTEAPTGTSSEEIEKC